MKLPLFTWARGYDRSWLRGDVLAGLTVWAVLVPEALAYATIAGVSPVVGLLGNDAVAIGVVVVSALTLALVVLVAVVRPWQLSVPDDLDAPAAVH